MEMDKLVKIDVWVPDTESLEKIIEQTKMTLESGKPRTDENGISIFSFYGSLPEAKKIVKTGLRCEIDETFGKELLKRQKEVSKIDRFKGGKKKPKGLGIKK